MYVAFSCLCYNKHSKPNDVFTISIHNFQHQRLLPECSRLTRDITTRYVWFVYSESSMQKKTRPHVYVNRQGMPSLEVAIVGKHACDESPEGAGIVPYLPVTFIKTNLFLHQALESPKSHFHLGCIKTAYWLFTVPVRLRVPRAWGKLNEKKCADLFMAGASCLQSPLSEITEESISSFLKTNPPQKRQPISHFHNGVCVERLPQTIQFSPVAQVIHAEQLCLGTLYIRAGYTMPCYKGVKFA